MPREFICQYDSKYEEVDVLWDGKHVFTIAGWELDEVANKYGVHWGEAAGIIIGRWLKEALENEDNGFFVSAVLTKLFGYGNDEWGRG